MSRKTKAMTKTSVKAEADSQWNDNRPKRRLPAERLALSAPYIHWR
ncbi:MAG: hypothetical protein OXF06_11550 [Bacteroidetes bacterium]|nr:hypothetical protein [Bacteroidota bacterium]MCY4225457.1 hypothetical protein [Bacteroidota bacterium]